MENKVQLIFSYAYKDDNIKMAIEEELKKFGITQSIMQLTNFNSLLEFTPVYNFLEK